MSILEEAEPTIPLVDQYERTISYLRISLTDRCNFRCVYCMPEDADGNHTKTGVILEHNDLLTYEEILRVATVATEMGVKKIRLTGGEPLVRRGVLDFIKKLKQLPLLEQLSLTTNGALLSENAQQLWDYGVRQLNISLDSLNAAKFFEITKRDVFDKVWAGILAAQACGFRIKINVVAMNGVNSDEFVDFARLALERQFEVRFIEFMPMGQKSSWKKDRFICGEDIMKACASLGTLSPCPQSNIAGPARMFDLVSEEGLKGKVGFISPLSHHFCDQCNRLRLTSEGQLRSCLLNDKETDLKSLLRAGGSDQEVRAIIRQTISAKPKGHNLDKAGPNEKENCQGQMSRIGG